MSESRFSRFVLPALVVLTVVIVHYFRSPYGEPWKNNDETRHVMTGVFFRDVMADTPASLRDPKGYATRYYTQYPALGLLVWPPLFYALEGVAMSLFGVDYAVARVLLAGFVLMAYVYVLRFTKLMTDTTTATIAGAVFLFGYLIMDLSRHVLLEMPCLAFVLASIVHFEKYLRDEKPHDALFCCGLAACAALTRFDAIVLLPYFGLRLLFPLRLKVMLKWPVILGIFAGGLVTLPYYAVTYLEYSTGLATAATNEGARETSATLLSFERLSDYPICIRWQTGYAAIVFALLGACVPGRVRSFAPAYALFVATYLTFTPLAEREVRHVVYWLPAVCLFAAQGAMWLHARLGRWWGGLSVVVLLGCTSLQAVWEPGWNVVGYDDAARYVIDHRKTDRPVFMDGVLNGGFIFHIRKHDAKREVTVLRGDKLMYAMLSDPRVNYTAYVQSEAEVLQRLEDADPEFIVLEQPQLFYVTLPARTLLRETILKHPDLFTLETTVFIRGNHDEFNQGQLEIYRKRHRNPQATNVVTIPVLGLGRNLGENKPDME